MTDTAIGPRGYAQRAAEEGAQAAREGATFLACPYTAEQPFGRRAWLAGLTNQRRRDGARMPSDAADDVDEDAPTPTT